MLFNTKYLIPDAGRVDFIECFTTTFLRAHSWLNWVADAGRGWGGNCIPCVNVLYGYYGCLYTATASASTSIDTSVSTCGHVMYPVKGQAVLENGHDLVIGPPGPWVLKHMNYFKSFFCGRG